MPRVLIELEEGGHIRLSRHPAHYSIFSQKDVPDQNMFSVKNAHSPIGMQGPMTDDEVWKLIETLQDYAKEYCEPKET